MNPDQLDMTELPPLTLLDVTGRLKYALRPMADDELITINGCMFAAEEFRFLLTKLAEGTEP